MGKPRADSPEGWVEQATASPREKALEEENARLSRLLGLVQSYHAAAGEPPKWMREKRPKKAARATACMQLSDLHLDEVVSPAEVGGLNAYNREIAELRLRRWADKACEMGERHRHEWDGAVVFLGGDHVSGVIHDELAASNADVLPGTMLHWAPRIAAALKQVADFYGALHLPSVVGNHGRMGKAKESKRRGRNSWDWLLVQMVRAHLEGDERITWDIAEGSYLFVPIYERFAYLTHGDEVKGGGGWAGIWTPLGRIYRQALELGAAHGITPAMAIVGHWHTLVLAHSRGLVANGSLKGWDEWSATMRFKPEASKQSWWIETPEHGTTLAGALFVEDRKAEGW